MSVFRRYSINYYNQLFKQQLCPSQYLTLNKFIHYTNEKDPAPLFFNKDVKILLKQLTRIDLNKVYRKRRLETGKLEKPVYKFMTDEELKQTIKEAEVRIDEMIQMPPVLKVREPIDQILSNDPALQGLEKSRLIFTDITFGLRNCDRLIVVREPDGILRQADWNIRDRMNQVYFPLKGREFHTPKMFDDENMENLFNRKEYEFLLDKACIQYEPDDEVYQELTGKIYMQVNKNSDFDCLRSTRHFGPFVFYLTWHKEIDNLLMELIETIRIDEAEGLIKLYGLVHDVKFTESSLNLVETFIKQHSNKKGPLELALQAYKEIEKERKELQDGIKAAHGHV